MEKKLLILIFSLVIILTSGKNTFSQEKDIEKVASASPQVTTEEKIDQSIKNLKEKIATKVAEMAKKNKKIFSGILKKINDKTIQVVKEGTNFSISYDELTTKFYQIKNSSLKEIEKKDLTNDDYLLVFGSEYDNLINADTIYQYQPFLIESGRITEINKSDYSFNIMTTEKESYILDVETYTKQQMMNIKNYQIEKIGFSKLKVGDTVHFVSYLPNKNSNRASLIRYLIIPQEYFIIPSKKN